MLFHKITGFVESLNPDSILEERKLLLQPLINHLQSCISNGEMINLNFICTHNSRRSHLAQIWGQAMAYHYNINNLYCYSGGTVATSIYPMVVKTLEDAGFEFTKLGGDENPIYAIKFAPNQPPVIGFSKAYNHNFNPNSKFTAIMTCSEANEACPIISGAENRIPLTYDDPKLFDDTPLQETKYHERSTQITTELCYVFSQLKRA
ncbi:low molecular weight phosphatase family protein [Arenibacter latericius]|uniref:protein-tyrosine-phosphatase n=1 Tax=Arenibacter latericius TaxID=86104 RepID=UPI0003FD3CDA|nr:protein-tyrosine-phosphatase [Arenibacter latericius]MDX1363904.1 protein-tyrosine-phosphatase [Arenibacter latericius]